MSKSVSNPFLCRYAPNQRFLTGAFINQQETKIHPVNYGPSITDKEAYRHKKGLETLLLIFYLIKHKKDPCQKGG